MGEADCIKCCAGEEVTTNCFFSFGEPLCFLKAKDLNKALNSGRFYVPVYEGG